MPWELEDYLPQGRCCMDRYVVLQRRFIAAVGVAAFVQKLAC